MSEEMNLRDTIVPKSDQMNADDLIGTSRIIRVTDVRRGSKDQPVAIHYDGDDGRPFKPCKSMRRVLIYTWGENGKEWIGRSMALYCDPSVKFGGVMVGGIRISHVSHIDTVQKMQLTATRGKRAPFVIEPLKSLDYPVDLFNLRLPKWTGLIESGGMTAAQVIAKCSEAFALTDEQKLIITNITQKEDM